MLLICFVLGGFARFFQVWQIYPCPMSEGLQLFQSRHIPVPVWSCYWVVAWMQAEDASTLNSVRYALDGMEQKERWESTKRVLLPTSGYIIVVILALLTLNLNYWNLKMRNHYESILFLMSCSVSHHLSSKNSRSLANNSPKHWRGTEVPPCASLLLKDWNWHQRHWIERVLHVQGPSRFYFYLPGGWTSPVYLILNPVRPDFRVVKFILGRE